jgi:cell division protein FtsL
MGRLNFVLIILIVVCALSLVSAQNRARSFFVALERANQAERQLENEWTQLQVEQVALSKGSRVEDIARAQLKMKIPAAQQTRYVSVQTLEAQLQTGAP